MKTLKFILAIARLLLCIALGRAQVPQNSATATSHDFKDSSFNALDFYSGRMVRGIGVGFYQFLEEQIDGRQLIELEPSLYYGLSNSLAIGAANLVSMKKINPNDKIDYTSDPINTTILLNAQIRPLSTVQIFPQIEISNGKRIYNSRLIGNRTVKNDTRIRNLGVDVYYVNREGRVHASPAKIRRMYFLQQSDPVVNKGQTAAHISATYHNHRYSGHSDAVGDENSTEESPSLSKRSYRTVWDDISVKSLWFYGLTNKLQPGLGVAFRSFKSTLTDNYLGIDNEASQTIVDLTIEPKLYFDLSDNLLTGAHYAFSQIDEKSDYDATFKATTHQKIHSWDYCYDLHWFTKSGHPSLGQALANYRDFFGNRLDDKSFHLGMAFSHTSDSKQNRYFKIFETRSFLDFYHPNLQFQKNQFELTMEYGVSDFIEFALSSRLVHEKSYNPSPKKVTSQWYDRHAWINQFTIEFGNYVYSTNLQEKYGWYELDFFNQYYKPLLAPYMVRGSLKATVFTKAKADDYFSTIESFNPNINNFNYRYVNNRRWNIITEINVGLPGNLECQFSGEYNFYGSDLRNYLDKDWDVNLCIAWQPFKTLRFEIIQNSARYVNNWDSRFIYYIDPYTYAYDLEFNVYNKTVHTWKLQILSLF